MQQRCYRTESPSVTPRVPTRRVRAPMFRAYSHSMVAGGLELMS